MRKGEFAMRAQNLTLLTDLYELTMMQGYYENPSDQIVVFDAFYRKNPCGGAYAVCAGLEQVIEYVRDLHFSPDDIDYLRSLHIFNDDFLEYLRGFHFTGDIYAIPEGTVVFPREPLLKVVAPIMEAQLVETAILNMINHQSLIATKASRVVYAAKGDGIMEFGLRRAQGPDAGIYGARAAMIGGCIGTSNVLTGQMFDVPVKGTHAHSWIMSFPDEYTAFKTYAKMYPEACILLVDTYDVLESGVPNNAYQVLFLFLFATSHTLTHWDFFRANTFCYCQIPTSPFTNSFVFTCNYLLILFALNINLVSGQFRCKTGILSLFTNCQ